MDGKLKAISMLTLLVLSTLASLVAVSAASVPVTIEEVYINDRLVSDGEVRGGINRGEDIDIEVRLLATSDDSNIVVKAEVDGLERNTRTRSQEDETEVFDVDAGKTYIKRLRVNVPRDSDIDEYDLRITVTNRRDDRVEEDISLSLDTPRHDVSVEDVVVNPSGVVQAGRALLTTVRVENRGEDDEEDVKVTVSIPELGVSTSDYLDELNADDEEDSEELYLRIPENAKSGEYTLRVAVSYNDGFDTSVEERKIKVEGTDEQTMPQVSVVGGVQELTAGGAGVAYPVVLTNGGNSAKTYMLQANAGNWATVTFSPSNVVVVSPGETQTVTMTVAANKDAAPGDYVFTVSVLSDGKVIQEGTLTARVARGASTSSSMSLKRGLEVGLLVLVVLLVVLALVVGFAKMRQGNGKSEEYY